MHESHPTQNSYHPAVMAIGGFLIGVVLTSAWFLEARLPRAGEQGAEVASTSVATSTNATSSLISVRDQIAGSNVVVDSVAVPAPGVWVAVEDLRDGQLGNVLGASRTLGPATAVTVHLLRATVPGATYAIVLYRDNGDREFNHTTDSVYVDLVSGERVVALFQTTL